MSDITSVLEGLRDGTVSTDDAAALFAARRWPVRRAHEAPAYADDLLSGADAELPPDGSFGEVEAAYAAGWINDQEYAALAQAAAAAIGGASDANWVTDRDGDNDDPRLGGDAWRTAPDIPARQDDLFPGGTKAADGAEHEVYVRGVKSYPGAGVTGLSAHDWATGRVEAFRHRQAGEEMPGYERDDDLLG